ncbi:hypothetical protein GQ457_15G025790 [Hibiscus cannabinus]
MEFVDTPLHVSAASGNTGFAMEMMSLKPSFARKLNRDSFSLIHLALLKDHAVQSINSSIICLIDKSSSLSPSGQIKDTIGTNTQKPRQKLYIPMASNIVKNCETFPPFDTNKISVDRYEFSHRVGVIFKQR